MLEAALAFIDREGLEALSMRKLGDELGVEAMSLYRYVAKKSDLLDGIHEIIIGQIPAPTLGGHWRTDVRMLGQAFRRVLLDHPRALPLLANRPVITAGSLQFVEIVLAMFREAGFDSDQSISALHTFHHYVVGHCLLHAGTTAPLSLPEMQSATGDSYPHTARAAAALAEHDPGREFEFGLDVVLAGLDAMLVRGVAQLIEAVRT
ncbi:MAG: TetR/AcrR family transcriptional regulator C-terminal domain-containing protein [Deltaproteobacteria bacterium]|nr:TetR/AcrR family transcriptional regulator C-terminal domain-containing protein [Deltaproteobacteria bacterium]